MACFIPMQQWTWQADWQYALSSKLCDVVGIHSFRCACLQTLRQLVGLSSNAQNLALLREVGGLVTEAPSEAFPRREAAWLATTAWNRGVHHAKFHRLTDACAFMEVALALLPACPDIQQQHGEVRSSIFICHLDSLLNSERLPETVAAAAAELYTARL